ncbi:MAG: amino acid permease [Dehalococcoidia bacterium]|nr:MAG: amino acid permease [Dehalococcoidia bacterium]
MGDRADGQTGGGSGGILPPGLLGPEGVPRVLTVFDVTNITVGAIVGADIYVASAITAGLLGPASLLAWLAAGVLATLLALTLAECARVVPRVGGPYAYVSRAFGPLPGFLAGWSMWIAEMTAMPVFAIAFSSYLGYFVALDDVQVHAVRVGFLGLLTLVNVISVRAAGRVNDALTLLKLTPLFLLVVIGLGYAVLDLEGTADRLSPFAPFGFAEFPTALMLVVWAYMGFELSTVPAAEVQDPGRTIPRGIAVGMLIVASFYLVTNLVVTSVVPYEELMDSGTPLILAGTAIFGATGAAVMAAGAMVSVSGSDESDMLGASRLAYAMAADGLLPHGLASLHRRFRTPYVALIAQGLVAAALSFVDVLSSLISFAVVNLAFSFLFCAASLWRFQRGHAVDLVEVARPNRGWRGRGARLLPAMAIVICVGLLAAASHRQQLAALAVLAAGLAVYAVAAPKRAHETAGEWLHDRERVLHRLARRRMRFLGGPVGWSRGHTTPPRRPRG